MNQPPGGGYPPNPQYPGQPGYPQQQPQQPQQAAPVGQPGAAKPFMGTALMPGAPQLPGQVQQQIAQAQAAQQQQQQQYDPNAQYGQPPQHGTSAQPYAAAPAPQGFPQGQPSYGQPPQGQPGFGQAPQGQYGAPQGAPQGQYGAPQGAPQGQYGAPAGGYGQQPNAMMPGQQQQQQGGMGMPQFGVGGFGPGGMPRISLQGGDFSPTKLMTAVTTGQGFEKPRKMGAIMVALAFALAIANSVLVFVLHRYYPYLYSVGAIFWWTGWWLLVTGQPRLKPDGTPAAMWTRIGLAGCFAMGVLVGAAMCFFNWEAMLASSVTQ